MVVDPGGSDESRNGGTCERDFDAQVRGKFQQSECKVGVNTYLEDVGSSSIYIGYVVPPLGTIYLGWAALAHKDDQCYPPCASVCALIRTTMGAEMLSIPTGLSVRHVLQPSRDFSGWVLMGFWQVRVGPPL